MSQQTPSPINLLWGLALTAVTAVAATGCADGPPKPGPEPEPVTPPSIILIVIDTLRADHLGAYGFDGPISPNLDALADESVLFERCTSQAPWTTPSMASMMTSLYPEVHGVRLAPDDPRDQKSWRERWTPAIPDSTVTLAEILRDNGYRTAAFVANPFLAKGLGFEQGFNVFDESTALSGNRDSTTLVEAGSRWLLETAQLGEPTFLYLHLMDVHGPYTAPETDFEAVRDSPGLGPARTLNQRQLNRIQPYLRKPGWARSSDAKQLRFWRGRYAAGVHAADRHIGDFVEALREVSLWDEQLVILTSDHGEELFDHGQWDHGFSLHQHQLHVPLFVRLPHGRFGGSRIAEVVRLVDVTPTLIELTAAQPPPDLIGRDLVPLMTDPGKELEPRIAFATSVKAHPGNSSVIAGRFKLVSDVTKLELRLFDLDADPGERTNIADQKPEIVNFLGDLLKQELARVKPGEGATQDGAEIPAEQLERLRELGYLQ